MGREAEASGVAHERARRAVFGFLGSAILHETNNVLTVMAGVRQLLKAGISLSDRVGGMIDQQLSRMEELVGWIRRLGPDDGEAGAPVRDLAFVLESVERIVQLVGKGRGIKVERDAEVGRRALDSEAAGLALLCVMLPLLPVRGRPGVAFALSGKAAAGSVRITMRCAPSALPAGDEPEWRRARELAVAARGALSTRSDGDAVVAELDLPIADSV